jgi:hypothetical protein
MEKKKHHYIPRCYLKFFCDEQGQILLYRKDDPENPIRSSPDNQAFHKYYYSQPLPEGGRDNNSIENLFSGLEEKWPLIVERMRSRKDMSDVVEDLFAFIGLQRVRVPACRDAAEAMLAETVKSTMRILDAAGELEPKPDGFKDILDHVEVAIDPHQSIHAMVEMLRGAGEVFTQIGIGALHNTTNLPFLTSDNPVVWFDPSFQEMKMRPYWRRDGGPVVMFFPVTPNLLVYGHSSMRKQFESKGFGHSELSDREFVKTVNRHICRFAYKAIYSQKTGHEFLIKKHSQVSPILRRRIIPSETGEVIIYDHVFGRPSVKPKW